MAIVVDPMTLAEIPLFEGLAREHLIRVAESLNHRHFAAGAYIVAAGQLGHSAYIVTLGTVKVSMDRADGSSVILAILGPGEIIGELSLVDALGHCATVVALEKSEAYVIDELTFRSCLRSIPAMAHNLSTILSRRLRLANEQILAFGTLGVDGRVARQILVLASEYGEKTADGTLIPLQLTQHDLADLVGASRVRVNQVIGEYKRQGVISTDSKHRMTLRTPDFLVQRCV